MGVVFTHLLDSLRVVKTEKVGDIEVTFLTDEEEETGFDYLLLDEAIETGEVEVTELEGGGSVSDVKVKNRTDKPVLLPEGNVLCGGKQNRVLNTSILIGASSEVTVPVSCVEQGRWRYQTGRNLVISSTVFSLLRSIKAKSVTTSYRDEERPRADQSTIWGEVASLSCSADFFSDTMDIEETMEAAASKVPEGETIKKVETPKEAKAVIVRYRETPLLFEFFSKKGALPRIWERIKKAIASDIIYLRKSAIKPESMSKEEFLQALKRTEEERHESPGEGYDVRVDGDRVVGLALEVGGKVLHAAAFTKVAD